MGDTDTELGFIVSTMTMELHNSGGHVVLLKRHSQDRWNYHEGKQGQCGILLDITTSDRKEF